MAALNIIRIKELCDILGVSRTTIFEWEKNGNLPIEKVKLGPNTVGFREADVEAWLNGELEDQQQTEEV